MDYSIKFNDGTVDITISEKSVTVARDDWDKRFKYFSRLNCISPVDYTTAEYFVLNRIQQVIPKSSKKILSGEKQRFGKYQVNLIEGIEDTVMIESQGKTLSVPYHKFEETASQMLMVFTGQTIDTASKESVNKATTATVQWFVEGAK